MVKSVKKSGLSKRNKWIIGVVAALVFLVVFVMVFGTPSAESVFKDMNDKMLQTKTVTVDQTLSIKGNDGSLASITSKMFMDMNSEKVLLAKGNFTLNISNSNSPMTVSGDLVKIGDSSYVKYNTFSSTSPGLSSSFSSIESKIKGSWIKVRPSDQFASMAKTPLEFLSSILPTPFANLDSTQRANVLKLLQDKSMYTIDESSKVDIGGVSAYKYSLSYDKSKYDEVAKEISNDVSYFKVGSKTDNKLKSLTVWVDIDTKQIIKIEFEGSTADGDVTGTFKFSNYNQKLSVDKPSDYFIESELLN
ncbi:MAG: hypothetical protein NTV39_01910 [Candidatus Saccharibacteria bacterium]|nr:hypothetical protein [Candidatus Saccharibacteria bacterium]